MGAAPGPVARGGDRVGPSVDCCALPSALQRRLLALGRVLVDVGHTQSIPSPGRSDSVPHEGLGGGLSPGAASSLELPNSWGPRGLRPPMASSCCSSKSA